MNVTSKLAINGMGRIGRTLFRVLLQKNLIQNVVIVNDIMPKKNLLYLLKYDSIRGPLPIEIYSTANGFTIQGHEIHYSQQSDLSQLPWKQHQIDIVVEATGLFTHSLDVSRHTAQGAKQVLLTTYSKDIPSTIWGVDEKMVERSPIVSPGDCTLNCVAPILKVVEQKWGIQSLHINVIQGYTTRQELLDAPYKGMRRGRAASHSIIPFEVNIASVLEETFPILRGKIQTMSTRVPLPCGALASLSIICAEKTDESIVNSTFENTSKEGLKNIVSVTYDLIVSADVLGNPHSSIIDGTLTRVTNGNHLRLLAWFDNEWGYANRLLDWLAVMSKD
jgi:glyceraldehyde 3-phosphate dehydrogenase